MDDHADKRPSIAPAGIVLGIGMGGFLDGILLHQIFQVHNMISARVPPETMENMSRGMVADGLFHLFTWAATLTGIALLWKALARPRDVLPSGSVLVGYLLAGWGWFNLVEGVVIHHLLSLHHVIERFGLSVWDWLYLASGIILIAVGHSVGRKAERSR